MVNQPSPTTEQPAARSHHKQALLPAIAAALLSFGVTLLFMSGAYVQDISLLREVPQAIWLFVCGVPTDNAMVLPLMMGFSIIALLVGGALVVVHMLRQKRRTTDKAG